MKKYAKRGAMIFVAIMLVRGALMAYSPKEFAFEAVAITVVYGLIGAAIGVVLYGMVAAVRSVFRRITKSSNRGKGCG